MASSFNSKFFNEEVFLRYRDTIIDPVKANLLASGVIFEDGEIVSAMQDQVGGNYITKPMHGLLGGDTVNYDGSTNITATALGTYKQGIVAIGRAKAFVERDFTYSITGKDFMLSIAEQTANFWAKVNQNLLLSVLKGVFASALAGNVVSKTAFDSKDIIDAVYGIGGDHQDHFAVMFMHSDIAKNVVKGEIDYIKYTDVNGITRNTNLFQWQGKLVIVNDNCPKVASATEGKTDYVCYILGEKSILFQPLPVLHTAEMVRDPATNGGQDTLYNRERVAIAPYGVSFKASAMAGLSPTNAELEAGASWELVKDTAGNAIDTKTIPLGALVYTL